MEEIQLKISALNWLMLDYFLVKFSYNNRTKPYTKLIYTQQIQTALRLTH